MTRSKNGNGKAPEQQNYPDARPETEQFRPGRPSNQNSDRFDVEEFNARFGLVIVGGRPAIIDEVRKAVTAETARPDEYFRIITIDALERLLANRLYRQGERRVSAARLWMEHPDRRQYEGLIFDPSRPPGGADQGGYYNLWQGFSMEPNPAGSCSIFLDHLRTNVADGNEDHFRYIVAWLAHLLQKPTERVGIALVLRGRQGTGKTIVGKIIGKLIEGNYALVDDPRYVVGNFNAHLASLLLLQVDEGFWAGDKTSEGRLKGLVTSEVQMIEFKGKDPIRVPNYVHLLVTSNSDWVVPAGQEERRFSTFDVGDHCMQNAEYFRLMIEQLESGGYGALLHFLLNFDLSTVDLRRIPNTPALLEQKIAKQGPVESWWFNCLQRGGGVTDDWNPENADTTADDPWPETIDCERVHSAYVSYCEKIGIRHRKGPAQFGIELNRLIPGLRRVRPRSGASRSYAYQFPSLADCRTAFEDMIRTTIDWETLSPRPRQSPDEEGA